MRSGVSFFAFELFQIALLTVHFGFGALKIGSVLMALPGFFNAAALGVAI